MDILWDIVPLLLLGLTSLGFVLYFILTGDRSVFLDTIMCTTMVMFAALVVYFFLRQS